MRRGSFGTGFDAMLSGDADGTQFARLKEQLCRDREARLADPGRARIDTTIRAYRAALDLLPDLRQQMTRRD